jgi:subtilase family serine protease
MRLSCMPVLSPIKRFVLSLTGVLVAVLALGSASLTSASASAVSKRLVRIGSAPVLPAGFQPLAAASSTQQLRISVALAPRHASALNAYASEVGNPASSHYREYLTVGEFAASFGASSETIDAVRAALKREGLTPGAVAPNHLSVDVVAEAGSFEKAFDLQLAHIELPGGTAALVNLQAPGVPASIAGDVQAIVGLDGLQTMRSFRSSEAARGGAGVAAHPAARATATAAPRARKHQPTACAAASSAASSQGAYTDNQIASAYNFTPLYDAGDEGAGVTVGVYELEPNLATDIAAYQSCYGTDAAISYESVDGGAGTGAGSGEAAFDIEQVIGFAPKAKLIVYQAPNSNSDDPGSGPYDLFAEMIGADKVSVISNSWGECEAEEGATDAHAENTLFEEAAIQGQTVISAAGDDGSEDCYGSNTISASALAVDDPGSQPFVTDVGGTSLTAIGSPNSEVVWNGGGSGLSTLNSGSGAGGGGISSFWDMPSYQSGAPAALGVDNPYSTGANCGNSSGDCREVPDVSADADPAHGYLIYFNGNSSVAGEPAGWQSSGGTSGAAPLWAAILADTDAYSACDGEPIGFANPALYAAAGDSETSYYHDITSGENDYSGAHQGLYPASADYDLASGLGTPNAAGLATVLCQDSLRLTAPVSKAVFVKQSVRLNVRTVDAAGVAVTVTISGLPAGVSYDPSTGVISGTPVAPGVHVVKISATDADEAVRSASFVLDVAGRPTISHLSLTKVRAGTPVLSLRLTPGRAEAPLSTESIELPPGLSLKRAAAVTVRALSGAAVSHTLSGVGRRVTIRLTGGSTAPLYVQFKPGALGVSTTLKRSTARRTKPKLGVSVIFRDSTGLLDTVPGTVTPTS